jgi:hypothetical protein
VTQIQAAIAIIVRIGGTAGLAAEARRQMKHTRSIRKMSVLLLLLVGSAASGCRHYTISERPEITAPSKFVQPPGAYVEPSKAVFTPPPGEKTVPGGQGWVNPK